MRLLKHGALAGNYFCLASMAGVYAEERHVANFVKAWAQFFRARATSRCEEAEAEPGRFVAACRGYIAQCLALGVAPRHEAEMAGEARAIQLSVLESLKLANSPEDADTRYRLAQVLRWCCETFGPAGDDLPEAELVPGWAKAPSRLPRWLLGLARPASAAAG
jgi:hypothetical protein